MKTNTLLPVCLLIGCLYVGMPSQAYAQNTVQDSLMYRIETMDNNVFIGRLVSDRGHDLIFDVKGIGKITILRDNIKKMTEIRQNRIKEGKYWFENPTATRYLFTANAIGLRAGHGYYQNTWIFFNNLAVGVTNNISLGGGLVPTFLFGTGYVPIWFNPKISIPVKKNNFYLAVSGLFGEVTGENEGAAVIYGIATLGNRDQNLSFGMGLGYAGHSWSKAPMFNISAMVRTSQKVYFITENYFFTADGRTTGIISGAIRWAPEHFAVDFGLIRPTEATDIIGIPWLGVTLPF